MPGTRHSVHILSFDINFRFLSGILMLKMLDAEYRFAAIANK